MATTKYQYGAPGAVPESKKLVGLPPVTFTSSRYQVLEAETNRNSTFVAPDRFGAVVRTLVTVAPAELAANGLSGTQVAPASKL